MHSSNQRTKSREHYLTFAKLKITSLFYTALLVMVVFPCVLNAQTAPNVSYGTVPNNFINSAIAPINSANTGGTINSGTYRNVTTFAGTGTAGATDNANPLLASFNGPKGIVKDLLGNYYVAEETGNKIRKIATNGAVTLVVSVGANVYDITINSATGDLYYTTVNDVICKLANTNAANYPAQNPTYANAVTIVAGSTAGFTNATGTGAKFNTPVGIAIAPDNSYLLIADQANHRIRKMTLPGYEVTTFAGTGIAGGSDAAATTATFYNPVDVIFASATLVYVGEGQNGCRVRKIENDTVTTLAGNSSGTYLSTTGFNDGTGTEAFMKYAFGLTIDNDGNLYVAETSNFKIRKITPSGVVSTIAGTLDVISGSTDAIGNNARFLYPEGVYFDKEGGFLLVCDKGNHKIRKIDLSGFAITPPLTAGLSIDSGTGIISGTPTAYSLATQYQNNFNSAEIGATANGGVPSSTGDATFKGELLLLTPKLGSKLGGFEIPATGINSNLLKVNFKLITEKTTGGADGLSYSFAPDASATATAPSAEIGTGTKLSISFADYGTSNRGVRLYYNPSIGTLNTTINTTLLAYSNNTSWIGKTAVVAINIDDLGKLTLTLDGVVLFNNVQLPDDYLAADKATWKHVFKAKTGGSNDTHALDDVSIQQGYGSTNYTVTASNGYGASVTNVAILVAEPLTVSTTAAIQVTGASAVSGGVINSASLGLVTQRGMVWGTTNNPTLTSNAGMTTQGVGTTFTSSITGLLGLTTYYARAYATSLSGTVYGSEISFTTLISPPNIDYASLSNTFVKDTAIIPLNATNTGGAIVGTTVSTFAGGGNHYSMGDGTGTNATFAAPNSIGFDASGNMYVSEYGFNEIRKISPLGVVTTLVINNNPFTYLAGIAVTPSGIVYAADYSNRQIYKINPDGTVIYFAGSGLGGSLDGTGLAATFSYPESITLDASENLYVADGTTVRKITPAGVVTTLAGSYMSGTADGTGSAAQFTNLMGIAITTSGTIYVTEGNKNTIRKITPSGVVTTLAGSTQGFADGTGSAAQFYSPRGIAVAASGTIYVADSYNHRIRMITPAGMVTTLAGSTPGFADGTLSISQFDAPAGITLGASGSIYVADYNNRRIRKIEVSGYTISPILPAGLSFDATTGAISGTPTVANPATTYTITATNAGGSSVKTIAITVLPMNPPAISYTTPNTFLINTAITPLNPLNTGGAVGGTTIVSTFAGSGAAGAVDGIGTNAQFSKPVNFAFDGLGNMYVLDFNNNKIRKVTPAGVVTTFAQGVSGPIGIAVTAAGIVYVSEFDTQKIRKIMPDGTISDFAGNSSFLGYIDGVGVAASFEYPNYIALDASENLYVTDNNRIRKITPAGVVSTISYNVFGPVYSGPFGSLTGIAVSSSGTIYVADVTNNNIRKISPGGEVTTLAGSLVGTLGFADGIGNAAQFDSPLGIVLDPTESSLYVTDYNNNKIRKILVNGVVTTLAGSTLGFADGNSIAAQFNGVRGIGVNAGSIYVADSFNNRIRKIEDSGYTISPSLPAGLSFDATTGAISGTPTVANPVTNYTITATNAGGSSVKTIAITILPMNPPSISYTTPNTLIVNTTITPLDAINTGGTISGSTVSTFAGSGISGTADGIGINAQFQTPYSNAFDASGNMYVTDYANHKIRKITPAGVVTTFAGSGTAGAINGAGTAAQFNRPRGMAVTAAGVIYVADNLNYKIRKIMPDGTVSDFAGTGQLGVVNGDKAQATFTSLIGIALDASENLYVVDGSTVRKISTSGVVSTFVGGSLTGFADGTGSNARFNIIAGIAVAPSGNIYVADQNNHKIRMITPAGEVTTLAGSTQGFADGAGSNAKFNLPTGIAVAASGSIYVADMVNQKIRMITPAGEVTTLAGSTQGNVDGPLSNAKFSLPTGVAIAGSGSIYVTDYNNNKIRKIELSGYTISPALPVGLSIDATSGAISGTPTVLSPATDYMVTAFNAGGVSSFTTSIAVASPAPTWNGTEWINGPVTANTPAFIEGNYTSVGTLEVGELTVKNNAAVVFQSGHNLTINGKLTVETGSTLTLENNANLVQTTNDNNSGAITIKRSTAPLKLLDYVLWSSPVAGQQLQSFSPATLSNRFYTYNSGTNLYNAVVSPSADTFTAGTGYLIRMPNDHATTPTIWTGKFTGIPNNGAVNLAVTSGTYNAMGNPYPSTLNADAFIDANGITEALYFWRKTNNSANPSYATYTKAGGVGTANSADPLGLIPNGVIQVGQGFIAKTTSSTTSFTNAMRTTNNGNQFLRTKNTDKSRIWLNLTNASGFFSQALVAYMDGATSGVDAAIDGRYFNDSKTALTSIINDEEFTIQGRSPFDTSDVVPLGFKTETAGDFNLAIDHTDGLFAAGQKVFLKDNLTNTLHDLSSDSYAFTSAEGVFNTRFEFRYQQSLGTVNNELESNAIVVYKQNDKIKIDAGALIMVGVKVYDLNGRLILERKNINANQAVLSVVAAEEVLLIKITSNDGIVITKKLIN